MRSVMSVPLQLVLLGLLLTFIAYQSMKEERKFDVMTSEMRILEEREELAMDREKLIQRNKERTQNEVKLFLSDSFLDFVGENYSEVTYEDINKFYKFMLDKVEEKF